MDSGRFDEISRRLAGATTRRGAVAALVAAGLGLGLGAGVALPGRDAEARKHRKKRCTPACGAGQSCVKGACRCDNGGTVCGAACCQLGETCRSGTCVELPNPNTCIAFGEACKNVGRSCCENLACGSGQGGAPVACHVRKTGRCTSTAECIYGTECVDGICVGLPACDVATCACPVFTPEIQTALVPNCDSGACGCTCVAVTLGEYEFAGRSCTGFDECGDPNQGYGCFDMAGGGISGYCAPGSVHCCCGHRDL